MVERIRCARSARNAHLVGTPVGTSGFAQPGNAPARSRNRHQREQLVGYEHVPAPALVKPDDGPFDELRSYRRRHARSTRGRSSREVDEFTAIAEKWRYWSDGVGELVPFCPEWLNASSPRTLVLPRDCYCFEA
jgi:hypothetical protein